MVRSYDYTSIVQLFDRINKHFNYYFQMIHTYMHRSKQLIYFVNSSCVLEFHAVGD